MTLLHDYFHLQNLQAFQRLLDGSKKSGQSASGAAGLSTSGGKSWNRPSPLSMAPSCDVNARDWLGRTVLHLACSSCEPSSIEYVRLLLAQVMIDVNLRDAESNWTALHRALYNGNIAVAILLLQNSADTSLKDLEGYTAFDLYNSTLKSTKFSSSDSSKAELFTWGANRNATLGLGDGDDRAFPEQVIIALKDDQLDPSGNSLESRFSPINVRQVVMSRLHTVVVTSENRSNLRVCGFGSGGRLGPGQHTQYSLTPLQGLAHTIVSVALGQDHTLALTKSGEVLSWGLNRFSQLGYVVEAAAMAGLGRLEEPIQASPRKVVGVLKKEIVMGVAACKTASACWTNDEVFTWGTNNGQLGYDKAAQPVQILPRKVAKITQPIVSLSITDTAMVCLLMSSDVICIWNDRHFKINFPVHSFPSEIHVYRPPQAIRDYNISKIVSLDDTFAALSLNGELFTFTVPKSGDAESNSTSANTRHTIKPSRVWALRKQFSAVKDVALGVDGSIIICTESGHVFVRSRSARTGQSTSPKTFKFQRLPYMQRVHRVCANNTGGFGAIRLEYEPAAIPMGPHTLCYDIAAVQPYLTPLQSDYPSDVSKPVEAATLSDININHEEDEEDGVIQTDIATIHRLLLLIKQDKATRKVSGDHRIFDGARPLHGADLVVQTRSGLEFPVHRVVLAARCAFLGEIISGSKIAQDQSKKFAVKLVNIQNPNSQNWPGFRLIFAGCHAITVLIFITYLYTDELPALWDRRVVASLKHSLDDLNVKPAQVKLELQALAQMLELPLLIDVLQSPVKRVLAPTMVQDMDRLFCIAQTSSAWTTSSKTEKTPLTPDVVLHLADRYAYCHSVLLRARSPFFAGFFGDEEWTRNRRDANGVVTVDMKHLKWQVMEFVLRFMSCGAELEMFQCLDFVDSVDNVLEFMFDVMSAANELLLDRLVIICSTVILKYLTINNACYILSDATHFHSPILVESVQDYMATNMELLLESHMLDDLAANLIKQLSIFIRQAQRAKSPFSRSTSLIDKALEKHRDWLADQDIPTPILRSHRQATVSPRLSPSTPSKRLRRLSVTPQSSPSIRPVPANRTSFFGDDLFEMDGEPLPALNLGPTQVSVEAESPKPAPVWKGKAPLPRVDMKTIMAEAVTASSKMAEARTPLPIYWKLDLDAPSSLSQKTPQREWRKLQWTSPGESTDRQGSAASPASSPWKIPTTSPAVNPTTLPDHLTPLGFLHNNSPPLRPKESTVPTLDPKISIPSTNVIKPSPKSNSSQPGLGPIFNPSRQLTSKSSPSAPRRVSGNGSAWTIAPVQPVVQPSPSGSSVSLVAIQQLQLDEQGTLGAKDRRSLREIQEEERSRKAEADFLKWWSAEEERLRVEAQGPPQQSSTGHTRSRKRLQDSKGKNRSRGPVRSATDPSPGPHPPLERPSRRKAKASKSATKATS